MHRLIVSVLLGCALVSGCKSFHTCAEPPDELTNAASIPALKVPVGLEMPSTKEALRVPDLNAPEAPRDSHGRCLEEPPEYRPGHPIGKPAADTKSKKSKGKTTEPAEAKPAEGQPAAAPPAQAQPPAAKPEEARPEEPKPDEVKPEPKPEG